MKKLVLSLAITSALGLTACDDTTLSDVKAETAQDRAENVAKATTPHIRVVFDPSGGNLSVPNDLLYSGTTDGTLEMPAEVAGKASEEGVDFSNPEAALGALDGWGTQNSFTVALDYDDLDRDGMADVAIDAATLTPDTVSLYQVIKYPSLTDPECTDPTKAGLICKPVRKLTYGAEYVATMSGDSIAIVPMAPFQGGASYVLALTNGVKATNGSSLMPSSTYASVEQDITTHPIVLPSLTAAELNSTQAGIRLLQTMVNNFEVSLEDLGADREEIVYTQAFTVQASGVTSADPVQYAKALAGSKFAGMAANDPSSVVTYMARQVVMMDVNGDGEDDEVPLTVAMALASKGVIANDPNTLPYMLFDSAQLYGANITVPYYLPSDETALSGRWKAMCDNGALLSAVPAEVLQAATPGPNHEFCASIGLADLGLDSTRHITKYNPVPQPMSEQQLDVQITLPDIENANKLRGSFGLPALTEVPEGGWPVVILQHGVTSNKGDMLAATGFMSVMGLATVAIDHPLHNSRGFTLENGMVINASSIIPGNDPTHYLNLASLLTARDNMRQSMIDGLNLRLALNAMLDVANPAAAMIDSTNVHYMGHSLGAITGVGFTAIANTTAPVAGAEALDPLFSIKSSVLANPGAGVGNFLVESGSFGPLVKASVIAGLGNELTDMLMSILMNDYGSVVAASPQCGAALNENMEIINLNLALVCSYGALEAQAAANPALQAGLQAGFAKFSFAAQTVIDAADPTNYAAQLTATGTPILMYEMVGDGMDNLSDQTVPNSVSTNPLAGTSGLERTLGLSKLTGTTQVTEDGPIRSIVEFKYGGHSTVLSPATTLSNDPIDYPGLFSLVNAETLKMASTFFASNNMMVPVSAEAEATCAIANLTACEAEPEN